MENNSRGLDLWFREVCLDCLATSFKIKATLFSGRSDYQQIDVVRTEGHGVMLINDGFVMLSERDEFIYHEMIAHVPLFVHPAPRRVLIIGGGDGGTAREVLRHETVQKAVMVEIDEMVVKVCRRYLPTLTTALDDPRLTLRIEDGVAYVKQTREKFDVVIIDSTDPIGPAAPLFNKDFYQNVAALLDDDGILITQAESPFYDHDIQTSMLSGQRPFFKRLHIYLLSTFTYPGGLWSFGFASKGPHPLKDLNGSRIKSADLPLRYYNAGIHDAAFMLPNYVHENLGRILDPIEACRSCKQPARE